MSEFLPFHRHGTLPFIGREMELSRIVAFWRETFTATEPRMLLLTGEAGIGKSRLVEQAVMRIVAEDATVIRVKFHPETTATLATLLARALQRPPLTRILRNERHDPTVGSTAALLKRIVRLRPTLVILEDIHHVAREGTSDLAILLETIATESLSMLATTRPVDTPARHVFAPYIHDDISLPPLSEHECEQLCRRIHGDLLGTQVIGAVHRMTNGNPMAMRSALMRIAMVREQLTDGPVGTALEPVIVDALRRTTDLLAEGMIVHLTSEELRGAQCLSTLGEVFPEAATYSLLNSATTIVDALTAKDILVRSTLPTQFSRNDGDRATLTFTHSLLHQHFVANARVDSARMIQALAHTSLDSIVPYRLLAECTWDAAALTDRTIESAFDRAVETLIAVDRSSQWPVAGHVWNVLVRLLACRMGHWSDQQWDRMLVRLAYQKISLVRRRSPEESQRWLRYLQSITMGGASFELRVGRLHALTYGILLNADRSSDIVSASWDEADQLSNVQSQIKDTTAYADFLVASSIVANSEKDTAMLRRISDRHDSLCVANTMLPAIRKNLERRVVPPLLSLFDTERELRSRLEEARTLSATIDDGDTNAWLFIINLFAETAMVEFLERACARALPAMRDRGMGDVVAFIEVRRQRVLAGGEETFASSFDAMERALSNIPDTRRVYMESHLAVTILDAALLRREHDHAAKLIARHAIDDDALAPPQMILLALHAPNPLASVTELCARCRPDARAVRLIDVLTGTGGASVQAAVAGDIDQPILRLDDILRTHCAVGVMNLAVASVPGILDSPFPAAVADAIDRSLAWLADPDRELVAYMAPLLELSNGLLPDSMRAKWNRRIAQLARGRTAQHSTTGHRSVRISVFGAVSVRTADGHTTRIAGVRMRMIIALMALDGLYRPALPAAEFCRLAVEDELVDLGNARDVVRATIRRLREELGHAAIATSATAPDMVGKAPCLDPEVVEVDLWEAHRLLEQAGASLREESPMRAKAALMRALVIVDGNTLFPSLYHECIESTRDEFENRLRSITIRVAEALVHGGAWHDATDILSHAVRSLQGDEDLMDSLESALLEAGRHTAAMRVRRHMASG